MKKNKLILRRIKMHLKNSVKKIMRIINNFFYKKNNHYNIIILQPGKVGSISVKESLKTAYRNLRISVDIYHAHALNGLDERIKFIKRTRKDPSAGLLTIEEWKKLRAMIDANPDMEWHIINLVRDPVAMKVSALFQTLDQNLPEWRKLNKKDELSIKDLEVIFYNKSEFGFKGLERWYDNQIKALWNIDVFSTPFPTQKGFNIYKSGNINLLVIRLEDLDRVAGQAFNEFLGLKNFKVIKKNIGDQKPYAELYKAFKEHPLRKQFVDQGYQTKFARHFYSSDEIESFRAHWIKGKSIPTKKLDVIDSGTRERIKPTVYLHVGPHKTGSTYLQLEFRRQEKTLYSEGIIYPKVGREYSPRAHHNIAWFYSDRELQNTTREKLRTEINILANSSYSKLLISSENFIRLSEQQLKNMRRDFENYDFHVLYFKRIGAGLVLSQWQTMVKHGFTLALNEMSLSNMVEWQSYNPFDHDGNIKKIKNALGERLSVLDYNAILYEKKDILKEVCDILEITLEMAPKIVNYSWATAHIEFLRAANLLYATKYGQIYRGREIRLLCRKLLRKSLLRFPLKIYLGNNMKKFSQTVSSGHFIHMGFPESCINSSSKTDEYDFIAGRRLLDELNKDNIFVWRILQNQIDILAQKKMNT